MRVVVLSLLLALALTEFIPNQWNGVPASSYFSPNVKETVYTDVGVGEPIPTTTVTMYTYEYNDIDNIHYVNLNFINSQFGKTAGSKNAGMAVFYPMNISSQTDQYYRHNIPETATIKEAFDYHYVYAYMNHDHYVNGYDVKGMDWNKYPLWFQEKVLTEGNNWIDFSQQAFLNPQSVKQHIEGQATVLPLTVATPVEPKKYVKFPTVKNATSGEWQTMDVELTYNTSRTYAADLSAQRWIYANCKNTWYIPNYGANGEVTTKTITSQSSYGLNGTSWFSNTAAPVSDQNNVQIFYQSKYWRVIHEHNVYFSEGVNQPLQTKVQPQEPPVIVPGSAPAVPQNNTYYMGYEHSKRHVKSAEVHYQYGYADLSQQHRQELYADNSMKSLSTPLEGEFYIYQVKGNCMSSANVWNTYYYINTVHNHTLLYGRALNETTMLISGGGITQEMLPSMGQKWNLWDVFMFVGCFLLIAFILTRHSVSVFFMKRFRNLRHREPLLYRAF